MENNGNEAQRNLRIIRAPTFRGKKDEHNRIFLKDRKVNALFDIEPHRRTQAIGICIELYNLEHYDPLLEANNNIQYDDLKDAMIRKVDQGRFNLYTRAKLRNSTQEIITPSTMTNKISQGQTLI